MRLPGESTWTRFGDHTVPADVQATRNDPVPLHLRNAVTGLMRQYGQGYKYAHDYEGGVIEQQHRPDKAQGHTYYRAGKLGWEAAAGGGAGGIARQ